MTTITDEALEQIRQLYAENFVLRDALLNPNPDDEPDVVRLHREKCDALDRITQLAAENERLREALSETERFMSYFSNETDGIFVGSGTPRECLAKIRAVLSPNR